MPFIFVSGTIGEERAIEALRCGAVDYVQKVNLERLAPARPCSCAGEGGERMSTLVFPIAATEEEDSSVTGRVLRTGVTYPAKSSPATTFSARGRM